jgi:glycosyltransferase involved in cell wall biosynthesis
VPFTLIYIGRLRENKKIDKLFDLYTAFKQRDYNVRLKIIGDGKMSKYIEQKQKIFSGIFWYGRITDESQIKKHMEESHLSVNLGLTGLSIVHSFYYGLPYVTLAHSGHGPEIDYLIDSYNGIIGKDILDAFSRIKNLMSNQDKYEEMSLNAIKTMEQISHLNWYQQMDNSISSI